MSAFTPARPGQVNEAGDAKALFLKVYAGEVLTTFDQANIFSGLTMSRSISSGKSASFPVSGRVDASFHTPGAEITGQNVEHNEKLVSIDDLLIAPVFIANLDEAMNHYDVRSIYSTEAGRALARQFDSRLARLVALAARASATLTSGNGGTQIVAATAKTDATALADAIFEAAQTLDENDVPEEDRHLVLKPAQYNLLVNGKDVVNKDWGGEGSFAKGQVAMVANVHIHKSNSVPTTDVAAVTGENNTYNGNFTTHVGTVFHKSAVGTVSLLDLAVEQEYSVRHQGHLIVAKYAKGSNILRPESAVEIWTGTPV